MSKFSGKCDFYDEIEIHGLDRILSGQVYLGDHDYPLSLKTYADCIPYFPRIVTMSFTSEGRNIYRLSEKSWVDIEARRYGKMPIHDYYRQLLKEEKEKYNE